MYPSNEHYTGYLRTTIMGRVLGIDFGTKRTGLAVTDPLKIIVRPLATVDTDNVLGFLKEYTQSEAVEYFVCGHPGSGHKETLDSLLAFVEQLKSCFPDIPIVFQDEQLSSSRASALISRSGLPRMKRRNKALIDQVSAVLILQEYLGHLNDVHSV